MADYSQLSHFEIKDAGAGNIVVLVKGSRKYYHILRDAFQQHRFSRVFDDMRMRFDWGAYIYGVNQQIIKDITQLLETFQSVVCIDDALDQTFALDFHSQYTFDSYDRTEIGDLVYNAKPYKRKPTKKNIENALSLVDHFQKFVANHPSYARSDFLVAVPCAADKKFDLPRFIVEQLCPRLEIQSGQAFVRMDRKPKESMKNLTTLKEKSDNIRDVFRVVDAATFDGKIVTIVDDIYESGITLHELADTLQRSGAIVRGLVATKTLKNPR